MRFFHEFYRQRPKFKSSQVRRCLIGALLTGAHVFIPMSARGSVTCQSLFSGEGARPSGFEEWFANPDWSGMSPIPAPLDGALTLYDDFHPEPTRIFFSVVESDGIPKNLQRLVKNLRRDTRSLSEDEAEMGAIVANYRSGGRRGIRFSSRRREDGLYFIHGGDTSKAINLSSVFPNRAFESVTLAVHLHSHPDLRNPRFGGQRNLIVPSVDDFEFWLGFRAELRRLHENPSFVAIVVPNGLAVGNIVFRIDDRHLDAYENEKKRRLNH